MHDEPPLMRGDDAHLPAGFIRECIVMGAFVLLVCVSLSASSVLRRADLLFFDIVQRLLLRPSPHKIVLIALDSASAHGSYTSNPAGGNVPPGGERFEFVGRLLGLGCVGLEQHGGRQQFDGVGQRLDGARRGQQRRRPLERRRGRLGGFGAAGGERRGRYARHRRGERKSAECRIEPVHAIAEHGEQPAHADAAADPADRFDGARGIAATAGMASIPHMDRDSSFAMGGGTATFQGRKAMAVGVQARITENLKATVNVGFAGSQRVVGAGMLYQWE